MYKINIIVNGEPKEIEVESPLKDHDKIIKIDGKWYIVKDCQEK